MLLSNTVLAVNIFKKNVWNWDKFYWAKIWETYTAYLMLRLLIHEITFKPFLFENSINKQFEKLNCSNNTHINITIIYIWFYAFMNKRQNNMSAGN